MHMINLHFLPVLIDIFVLGVPHYAAKKQKKGANYQLLENSFLNAVLLDCKAKRSPTLRMKVMQ